MAKAKKSRSNAKLTPGRARPRNPLASRRPESEAPAPARPPARNARTAASPSRKRVAVEEIRGAPVAVAGEDPVGAIQQLLDNLREARVKLQSVQTSLLSDEQFREFSKQSNALDSAISRVGNAKLELISAKLAAELPALAESTERLKRDLQRLKNSVAIISAVASALGIIESIAKLFARPAVPLPA